MTKSMWIKLGKIFQLEKRACVIPLDKKENKRIDK